jgi:uncharacterized membrane protein YfcA
MSFENFEPTAGILIYIAAVYLATGVVKGVLGIDLPLISIPLLAGVVGPITAMALLAVPTFVINIWQTAQSGYMMGALRRFRVAYPLAIAGVLVGVGFLTQLDGRALFVLVGVIVILIAVMQLLPFNLTIPQRWERWCTPLVGISSGLIGGVSNFLGPFMAMYLVALRVTSDQFVGAIALFYLIAAIPFYGGLAVTGHFGWAELAGSTVAAFLIWLGVLVGQRLRARTPGDVFRKLVLVMLIVIGANMIRKGLM